MGRWLTPQKIALLALAKIYAEGYIPISSRNAILNFLITNILPNSNKNISITEFEDRLASHASKVTNLTVWDLLLRHLWAIKCSNSVDASITSTCALLAKSRLRLMQERDAGKVTDRPFGIVVRTSPMGVFIRRCYLEYTRLQFQDSVAIWLDLIVYRSPTQAAYERKFPQDDGNFLDRNLSDLKIDSAHPMAHMTFRSLAVPDVQQRVFFSGQEVEKLLEFHVSEMQRIGGRLSEDMRSKFHQTSVAGQTLPKPAHYLNFLDSWRAGDFASAFDNLHRYFDYTMQTRDRTFYQYALLNLAILQADFGCYSEAIPAIQEAIATARENKDAICLNFCLSWLYHFGRSFPVKMQGVREKGILGNELEGLQFLKSRAKDAEMWSLLSSCLLSEAKLGLQHGDSIANVFENIVKAAHINLIKGIPNIMGPVLLMKASVFGRIGQTHKATMCGEMFLECYATEAPLEDVLKCCCRLANMFAQQGRYAEADAMMASVSKDTLRVLKYQKYWTFYGNILKLRRLLHRGDFDTALVLLQRLQGQEAPDIEMQSTLSLLEIDYYCRKTELSTALSKIEELANTSPIENHDIIIYTKLLVLKADIHARSGKPLKGFSIVMRAANLAYNARMLPSLWEAMLGLAMILISVQEFSATRSLLEAIISHVLECQDGALAARSHSLLADTFIGLAGVEDADREEYVGIAVEHLDQAFEHFQSVEDLAGQLDCLAKQARIQFWRGNTDDANDTANQYLEVRQTYLDTAAGA